MKCLAKYILIFSVIICVFNILLFISSVFPSEWIQKNVEESAEILKKEGNEPFVWEFFYIKNDNYTDALIINTAYSIDFEEPIYSYMTARKNFKKGITQKQLKDIQGELRSIKANTTYEYENAYDSVR